MSELSTTIKNKNPKFFLHCSSFFESKDQSSFIIKNEEDAVIIQSDFPKADPTTNYYLEITSNGCEFYFSNNNKGIYVEVLNEFDDFDDYFTADKKNGSTIASLLREKYSEAFSEKIAAGEDLELDEDFNLYFIDNFVNYLLNDVFLES